MHNRRRSSDSSSPTSVEDPSSPGSGPSSHHFHVPTHADPIAERVGILCTLWIHDEASSREEVILNTALFPPDSIASGRLAAIVPLQTGKSDAERQNGSQEDLSDDTGPRSHLGGAQRARNGHASMDQSGLPKFTQLDAEAHAERARSDADPRKTYVFLVREMSSEQRAKQPNLQVRPSILHLTKPETHVKGPDRFRLQPTLLKASV